MIQESDLKSPVQNTKTLIIQESIKLFYENGYDKTSMRQIAKACNISHPTIFSHFKSKTAIADIMFFRNVHGVVTLTRRFIENEKIDAASSQDGLLFYWTTQYYLLKTNPKYFIFFQGYSTPQRMGNFVVANYMRQVLKNFAMLDQTMSLENQLICARLVASMVIVIAQCCHEELISMDDAIVEHFRNFYAIMGIHREYSDQQIRIFLNHLDKEKYLNFDLLNNILLTDFGKPYGPKDTDNLLWG